MPVRLATHAMNTRFELVIGDAREESELRAIGEQAIEEIQHWHRQLNYFANDSEVSRINQLASQQPVRIEPETFQLLRECQRLHTTTLGAFDITIAPLMRIFGFRNAQTLRNDSRVATWGTQHIRLNADNRTIFFEEPTLQIDLGGIAKGWALDRAAAILREHDITSALMHGGTSSVVAIGSPPQMNAWSIAIQSLPIAESESHESSWIVKLNNQALAVSAPHGRETKSESGEIIGHVIDPRNGHPAKKVALAAVVSNTAMEADAWATAITVLGKMPSDQKCLLASLIAMPDNAEKTHTWLKHEAESRVFFERPISHS